MPSCERLIDEDAPHKLVTLDLEDVRLVDREAVGFLARCKGMGIRLENLLHIRSRVDLQGGKRACEAVAREAAVNARGETMQSAQSSDHSEDAIPLDAAERVARPIIGNSWSLRQALKQVEIVAELSALLAAERAKRPVVRPPYIRAWMAREGERP